MILKRSLLPSLQKFYSIRFSSQSQISGLFRHKFVDGTYIGPWPHRNPKLLDILQWQLIKKNPTFNPLVAEKIDSTVTSVSVQPVHDLHSSNFTWMGHSSVLIRMDGLSYLTDPMWSSRASPFQFMGPRRLVNPPIEVTFKIQRLPTISFNESSG